MTRWEEQRPSEDFFRILSPDGELQRDPPGLDDETLLRMYRAMVGSRALDEKTLRMQRRGEISIIARCTGEEATPAGAAAALAEGDWCFPTYRQKSALLYWGVPVDRAVARTMGAEPETVDEHLPVSEEDAPPVNFSPAYIPLAVNVTNAVGSAMVDRFDDGDAVTLSFIGEGSTSEGDFHEAMNFAGVFEVPSVTICQNNQWAISVPAHRQTAAETFARKAEAYGVPHERVDGNDVLAVYRKTAEAVERARASEGPTFIEAVTYRMDEHNTADEESVYRTEEEREFWEDRDPVDRFEAYLRSRGVLDDGAVEAIDEEVRDEIQAAVDRAREVPVSDPMTMFDHHLHTDTWKRRHQRQELRAELEGRNPFTDFTGGGLE